MNGRRQWISYISPYREGSDEENRIKNVGFVKVDLRNGRCRIKCFVRDTGSVAQEVLEIGLYCRSLQGKKILSAGELRMCAGVGEKQLETKEDNVFHHKISMEEIIGICLVAENGEIRYDACWAENDLQSEAKYQSEARPQSETSPQSEARPQTIEPPLGEAAEMTIAAVSPMSKEDIRPVQAMPHKKLQVIDVSRRPRPGWRQCAANQRYEQPAAFLEQLPEPDLWETLCCYYPKILPQWQEKGIDLLQIRPADIRYLPQRLWHFGSNSFLLHGYYQYRHLVLGQIIEDGEKIYILGVQGTSKQREAFSAELFGFGEFLPVGNNGQGYWYTRIAL